VTLVLENLMLQCLGRSSIFVVFLGQLRGMLPQYLDVSRRKQLRTLDMILVHQFLVLHLMSVSVPLEAGVIGRATVNTSPPDVDL
jgi:hypothetical protein